MFGGRGAGVDMGDGGVGAVRCALKGCPRAGAEDVTRGGSIENGFKTIFLVFSLRRISVIAPLRRPRGARNTP